MTTLFTRSRLSLAGLLAGGMLAVAQGPSWYIAPPEPPTHDAVVTRAIETALAAEPTLAGVKLTISVVDGVAVVGGAVPATVVIDRLEPLVAAVPGVRRASVACWTAAPTVPPADPRPPATRTVWKEIPQRTTFLLEPVAPVRRSLVAAAPPPEVYTPPAPPGPTPYPVIPSPRVPVRPLETEPAAGPDFGKLAAQTPRFSQLTVSLLDGVATIRGAAAADDDAWDFAELVRRAEGVTRVRVGPIRPR